MVQVPLKSDKNKGSLHGVQYTFVIISRRIFLRMRNISDKICTGNPNTHFMFSNICFRKSYCLWDNVEKYGRARQATDGNMAHAHCTAFARQQWLRERASVLRYACTACLVYFTMLCLRMMIWEVFARKRIGYCPSICLEWLNNTHWLTHLRIANVSRTRFETGTACIQAVTARQIFIMETNYIFCETALCNGDELCCLWDSPLQWRRTVFSVRQNFTVDKYCVFCEAALYSGDELCCLWDSPLQWRRNVFLWDSPLQWRRTVFSVRQPFTVENCFFCETALYNGEELCCLWDSPLQWRRTVLFVRQPFTVEKNCVFCETALYSGEELCFLWDSPLRWRRTVLFVRQPFTVE